MPLNSSISCHYQSCLMQPIKRKALKLLKELVHLSDRPTAGNYWEFQRVRQRRIRGWSASRITNQLLSINVFWSSRDWSTRSNRNWNQSIWGLTRTSLKREIIMSKKSKKCKMAISFKQQLQSREKNEHRSNSNIKRHPRESLLLTLCWEPLQQPWHTTTQFIIWMDLLNFDQLILIKKLTR